MTSIMLYITDTKGGEEEVRAALEALELEAEATLEWLGPVKGAFRIRLSGDNARTLKRARTKVDSRVIDLGGNTSLFLTPSKPARRRRW